MNDAKTANLQLAFQAQIHDHKAEECANDREREMNENTTMSGKLLNRVLVDLYDRTGFIRRYVTMGFHTRLCERIVDSFKAPWKHSGQAREKWGSDILIRALNTSYT